MNRDRTAAARGRGGPESGAGPARVALFGFILLQVFQAVVRAQPPGPPPLQPPLPTDLAPLQLPPEPVQPGPLGPAVLEPEPPASEELNLESIMAALPEGMQAEAEEMEAWLYSELGHHIRAREAAEVILEETPGSYLAHLVLAMTHHYAESNLPRALFHLERARQLFERRHGPTPASGTPWRWHIILLKELAVLHGDLERYPEQLAIIARYNELYEPDLVAERAWPLMKLRRFREARLAAELGLATDRYEQRKIALNALCAIEFEAGDDQKSYRACGRALEDARQSDLFASSVDLTNLAEAARALFKLDEAESLALEATRTSSQSWYANPWLELSELYLRAGRFQQALRALREIQHYRARRPPHARHADRNEVQRALAAFLLAAGRPRDAMNITARALAAPDRRSHASRDPLQDRMVLALLDRRARLSAAERWRERAAVEPLHRAAFSRLRALWLRLTAWRSAQQVRRLLQGEKRLVGAFRIGTSRSAVTPPWLLGDLAEVLGAGVAGEALRRARRDDPRPGAGAYYDALGAEVHARWGEPARARALARAALGSLGERESMLRARVMAAAARAAGSSGNVEDLLGYVESALFLDPGVFRRLDLRIPVRIDAAGGELAQRAAELLAGSRRLLVAQPGLVLRVRASGSGATACLLGRRRSEPLGCGELPPGDGWDAAAAAASLYISFHRDAFAPRVDLTRADINAIVGGERMVDDQLKSVLQESDSP